MNDVVSIVVPVYNTDEQMFRNCMESIINQNYNLLDVIIVDDGSTSGIEKVCDEYSDKTSFIRVIHKKNGGLAAARNSGQKLAIGKWIMFVDSDDWIDKETCSSLINYSEEKPGNEIVAFGYIRHIGDNKIPCDFKFKDKENLINTQYQLVEEALQFPSLLSSSCWKFFSLDFLTQHHLMHNEHVRQGSEDLEFMVRVLIATQKVLMINQRYYHYKMNPNSITNSFNEKNTYAVLECFKVIGKTIEDTGNKHLKEMYYIRSWMAICSSLISGYFNPSNGLRFYMRKKMTKKYLKNEYCLEVISNVNYKKLPNSRRLVYYLVKKDLYYPIYLIAILRGKQKGRI